ncbi:MauE/DoxX family redox-associated membrane protein [Acetobacter estunensis]|uniref:MauE/DoxX family redox-associated membrane protein n=1 Tax=Acetobacter estunensis TaxID=104097 RepID=UPI00222F6770|nr:MauE/DoxX family redox-associated membrane protein [Acetobacter estunensis]
MITEGVSAVCAGGIGMMFLVAGIAKLREHDVFLGVLASYRLLPGWMLEGVAWMLGVLEVTAGASLLSGLGAPLGGMLAALMLMVFAVAMGVNVARGRTDLSCGCTPGMKGERLSWTLTLRTLACVMPALAPFAMRGGSDSLLLQVEGVVSGVALWLLWQSLRAVDSEAVSLAESGHA